MADTAKMSIGQKTVELPILKGVDGPDVVDIRKLYAEADVFTYDPGFTSTASCESKITFIDGDAGILLHRGYPIDQLAEKSSFLEVCYLLLHGELPNAAEAEEFEKTITYHTMLHEQFDRFFQGFRRDAHPMAIMVGAVGALSAFYHDSTNVEDPQQRMISSHRLIAKMPTIAARAFKYFRGQPGTPERESSVRQLVGRVVNTITRWGEQGGYFASTEAKNSFHGRQPLRLHRGRHRLPLGSEPRRRERRGAEHAQGDRHRRSHP